MWGMRKKLEIPTPEQSLPGRAIKMPVPDRHYVNGHPLHPPFTDHPSDPPLQLAVVAMGCFWGAEKGYWELNRELDGVYTTAAGYMGGYTPNPSYEEVCSGQTGHTESVLVVFDPAVIDYAGVLKHFWEDHDPTQGMRQGNDRGTQYRSAIFALDEDQARIARASADAYQERLTAAGYGTITTEIIAVPAPAEPYPAVTPPGFFYAEAYHQQYLAKNPGGYCPVHATGVSCPVGLGL